MALECADYEFVHRFVLSLHVRRRSGARRRNVIASRAANRTREIRRTTIAGEEGSELIQAVGKRRA